MNIKELQIPSNFEQMVATYKSYQSRFVIEMSSVPNHQLLSIVDDYFEIMQELSRSPELPNIARTAIGLTCLHEFGYNDFSRISRIFDRIIPQIDIDYVKFTSWCAGILVRYPKTLQSRYITHLLERSVGWIRATGRRSRHLAAVCLIQQISMNSGSYVVDFFQQLQSVIWILVSHPSMKIVDNIAEAIKMLVRAMLRYRRSDLPEYLKFFDEMCIRLISFGSPLRIYTALKLMQVFFRSCPDFYSVQISDLYDLIIDSTYNEPILVKSEALLTIAYFSYVDPKQFINICIDGFKEMLDELLDEFPNKVIEAVCILINTIPDFMMENLEKLKKIGKDISFDKENQLLLLNTMMERFKEKTLPIDQNIINECIKGDITENYIGFFTLYSQYKGNELEQNVIEKLTQKIKNEYKEGNKELALSLISSLPFNAIHDKKSLMSIITENSMFEEEPVRKLIPAAVLHLALSTNDKSYIDNMRERLYHLALFDPSNDVRCSILSILCKDPKQKISSPQELKYLQLFANDGSPNVRKIVFKAIKEIQVYNPLYASSITRRTLLEHFSIIKNVPDIILRAKTIKTLPDLISASSDTTKIYAKPFMEIATDIIQNPIETKNLTNFIEIESVTDIKINIIDSIALIAPVAPNIIADDVCNLLPHICKLVSTKEDRDLVLAVLHLLFVLMSPPASTIQYRVMAPLILQKCSQFLMHTQSRKCKMSSLRVVGAIGILDVHQTQKQIGSQSPENTDEELLRDSYIPSKDSEKDVDDTMLLKQQTCDNCYTNIIATNLLKMLNDKKCRDLYPDTANVLCEVLSNPKMYMLSFFDSFFIRLLEILETCKQQEYSVYLPILSRLVSNSTHNSTPYLQRTLNFVVNKFNEADTNYFLDIIIAFCTSVRDAFAKYASIIIQILVNCLETNKSTNYESCQKVLTIFSQVSIYSEDLLYLIIPQLCFAITSESALSEVRIEALRCISIIGEQVQLYMFIGPILRAMNSGIVTKDKEIVDETFKLLYTLLNTQGRLFLYNSMPLISLIRSLGLNNDELEKAISKAETMEGFTPIITAQPIPRPKRPEYKPFTEEKMIIQAANNLLEPGRRGEQLFHSFVFTCIQYSPCDHIKACKGLAVAYRPLAKSLFKIAFYSCWHKMSYSGRESISHDFADILFQPEGNRYIKKNLMDLNFFMNKFDSCVKIDTNKLIKSALDSGFNAFALCLQDSIVKQYGDSLEPSSIIDLIDNYTKLGKWVDAVGVWKTYSQKVPTKNKQDILIKLKMWDNALITFQKMLKNKQDLESFKGVIKSHSHLGNWEKVIEEKQFYSKLNRKDKRELLSYFGNAAYTLERWDILDEILEAKSGDSIRGMVLEALNEIRKGNYDIDKIVTDAWSVLVSRPITFWGTNQQIHKEIVLIAQQLVEVLEIKEWVCNKEIRPDIENVWRQRLQTAPRNFEYWFKMISNREKITHVRDNIYIELFQLKSESLGAKMNTQSFHALFTNFDFNKSPDLDRICYVVNHWTSGEKNLAIQEMNVLTQTVKGELIDECNNFYATWILEMSDSTETLFEAYNHLKKVPIVKKILKERSSRLSKRALSSPSLKRYKCGVAGLALPTSVIDSMEIDANDIDVLRKWADVNSELILRDKGDIASYVNNAISALTKCCITSPSFTDVVQLFNLFFDYAEQGDVFEKSAHCIRKVPDSLLLQASPQLLVQLSHQSEKVAKFVHDLMLDLLNEHYHALIFSLIVSTYSNNEKRAKASQQLYGEFCSAHPEESEEVILIRKTLLRAAVTWYEKCYSRILDACDLMDLERYDDMIASLKSIIKMASHPKCELHRQFLKQYGTSIKEMESIANYFTPESQSALNALETWCRNMTQCLEEDIRKIRYIKLTSLSEELDKKTDFKLAVFGTYKAGKSIIHIKYFVGQFYVYDSKQQPKDIILRGDDGNFYQYLVKGHEDLRLDERIMQFFRLVNTFLRKETVFGSSVIGTISVIPLSMQHGLVSWFKGTMTLRSLVEDYRELYGKETLEEYRLLGELSHPNFDSMLPIQKQQVIERICRIVPETDIANFIKLKAATAEIWLKQTQTFARSTAMTSIVGYIIGLGDRHPSNLLVDKLTGKVVHIDFGDCFERAAKRKVLPEVVPFRLTRMIVSAMGINGTKGTFYSTFINTSRVLRENRRVLVMVLSIFVHEPLVEPEEFENVSATGNIIHSVYDSIIPGTATDIMRTAANETQKQTSIEIRNRVNSKLSGTDFNNEIPLTVEEQANILIESATNNYNLAKMYSGWFAFW